MSTSTMPPVQGGLVLRPASAGDAAVLSLSLIHI